MKKFVKQLLLLMLPIVFYGVLVLVITIKDPFKIFGSYTNYYETSIVDLNREFVCLQLFKNNYKQRHYDSFIFGSSRSLSFKVPNWKKHLNKTSVGFHFDATGESIYGIYSKLHFLEKNKVSINNALLIIDYSTLVATEARVGHLFITPPELSTNSQFMFNKEFVMATSNAHFIKEYFQYIVFKKYDSSNQYIFPAIKNTFKSNNITGDIYFESEHKIALNAKQYYSNKIKKGTFYDRSNLIFKEKPITNKEVCFLTAIKNILLKNKTNYKIVISPLYDQKRLNNKQKQLICTIFGKQNIFDFSGKNKLTNSIYNFYETSHYRPNVANEIMNFVYKKTI